MSDREPRTLVEMMADRAKSAPEHLATIALERGRWVPTSVGQLVAAVAALAVGLEADGLARGERVAIVLGNVPQWLIVDLAVQAAGGVSVAVPLQPDDEALAEVLQSVDASVIVVDDAVAGDRIAGLVAANRLDPIRRTLQLLHDGSSIDGIDDLSAEGASVLIDRPDAFDELIGRVDRAAAATITFSSGSGGEPRPVVHSAESQLSNARSVAGSLGLVYHDVVVTSLEPSHPFERSATIYPMLVGGSVLAYPEGASTIDRSSREVRPTVAHVSELRLRGAASSIHARFRRNSGVKKLTAMWWMRSAMERVRAGHPPSRLVTRFVGRPALRSLGWENLRYVLVAGDDIPFDIVATMTSLGLEVYSGYGMAEAGIVAVGHPHADAGLPTVEGVAVGETDGQLVVRSAGVGLGYGDGSPFEYAADRGLLTGDLGSADGDNVVVRGSMQSLVTLANGHEVLVAEVEHRLRDSPYIAAAVVRRDDGALRADIEIDAEAVGEWATEAGLTFTTFSSLAGLDEVAGLIAAEIDRLAGDVVHHDVLTTPLQLGSDITRTGRTMYRGLRADESRAPIDNGSTTAVDNGSTAAID